MLNLQLSEQMVMVIMQKLGAAPHNEVRAIIDEIVQQISRQRQPPQEDNVTRLRDGN